ncbi:MAG: DUF3253 domain-containing protein [Deltaproteobacteria bacterium]|nr:DUF3253 domain-containing protein [Deltaproteobacteria bacterium]
MDIFLCEVCHRPGPEPICSRRCQGLRKLKSSLNTAEVRRRILEQLAKLEKDSSICPGRLAKIVLDSMEIHLKEERDALSILREDLFTMRDEGVLRFFQKNVLVPKARGPLDLRGPFRLKPKWGASV